MMRGLNSLEPLELVWLGVVIGGGSKAAPVGVMLILLPLPEHVSYFIKFERLSRLSFY